MSDREKVIKGLECAIGIRGLKNCDDCPYDNDFNCLGCDIVMWDAVKLLKEQEPVRPKRKLGLYICGACETVVYPDDKFCHECGRELDWHEDH